MRLYIPAAKHAAHMALKRNTPADHARFSAVMEAIHETARTLYNAITTGEADEAHQRHTGGQLLTIYHRSTRPGVTIQASTFYRDRSGSWTASSHHDINRPEDIELHPGEYLTITEGDVNQ